jgi:PIF1 helicase.
MRIRIGEENQQYAAWIRDLPYNSQLYGHISLPASIVQFQSFTDFCNHVFPLQQLAQAILLLLSFRSRAILSMHNDTVTEFNNYLLEHLSGTIREFNSIDSADTNDTDRNIINILLSFFKAYIQQDYHPHASVLRLELQ